MSQTAIRCIVFDLGGVLLDWNPRYVYGEYFDTPDELERFLIDIDFAGWNSEQDRGRSFAEGVEVHSAAHPEYAPLIRAYHEHWERSVRGPIAGTVKIARELKSAGYALYALSNWSAETFPMARRRYDFLDVFDALVISGEVGLIKPDPRIFELLLQRAGRVAAECLFIDDGQPNIDVARGLGFQTMLFESPEQLRTQLMQLGLLR